MIRKHKIELYPVDIYIASKTDFEEAKKKFYFYSTVQNLLEDTNAGVPYCGDDADGGTFMIRSKKNGTKGVIVFLEESELLDGYCFEIAAHESTHVADIIWDIIGAIGEDSSQGNEPYAYLLGWIAGKVGQYIIDTLKEAEDGSKEK